MSNTEAKGKNLRIIYMGTPEFAVPALQKLVENGWNVVGVITAPDKPQGRGQKLVGSPVKEAAEKLGLHILQPTNLKNPEFQQELRDLNADLQIVVAFRMLPESVWNMPPLGTFNLHGSLLPNYRGAAPINWAIINGEKETGVTTFFLKHEIDTGSIIFQEKVQILDEDDLGSVYEKLMTIGAELVVKTVEAISKDEVHPSVQDESQALHHAPKIFKETGKIDWANSAESIHNLIRGLSPYPAAWTEFQGKTCKVFKSAISPQKPIGQASRRMGIGREDLPEVPDRIRSTRDFGATARRQKADENRGSASGLEAVSQLAVSGQTTGPLPAIFNLADF